MKRNYFRVLLCMLLILMVGTAPLCASAASKKVIPVVKVTVNGGRLRAGPSSAFDVITSLSKDDRVFYLNENEDAFCLVRTSTGQIGYIYRGFLAPYGAVLLDQIFYANADNVRVYKRAATNAGRVDTLEENEHVIVYKIVGKWAYVKTLDGKGGFALVEKLNKAA